MPITIVHTMMNLGKRCFMSNYTDKQRMDWLDQNGYDQIEMLEKSTHGECSFRDIIDEMMDAELNLKHTPGPWTITPFEEEQRVAINSGPDEDLGHSKWETMCDVYGCNDDPVRGFKKAMANAKLISQAPRMYEVIKRLNAVPTPTGIAYDIADIIDEIE